MASSVKLADEEVLAYIGRETARYAHPQIRVREPEREPLGGVGLEGYRTARDRLARAGLIVRTPGGRWVTP
jgi:hypothetical protein